MTWIEVSGSDADEVGRQVAVLCEGKRVEKCDAAGDRGGGLASALGMPSLFGAPDIVLVTSADRITAKNAAAASKTRPASTVVFTGSKGMSAAVRKKFPDLEVRRLDLPNARTAAGWCQQRAADRGVQLPREALPALASAVSDSVGAHRFDTAVSMLSSVGATTPTAQVLEDLLSGSVAEVPIWVMSDAVARGDAAAAVDALRETDPIAALSVATTRVAKLAYVLSHPAEDPASVAKVVGGSPAAARMLTRGVTAGAQQVSEAFDILVQAEVQCRSGRADSESAHHVVLSAVLQVCALLSPQ